MSKGSMKISKILLSYIRILAEQLKNGKVDTVFLESEAEKLLKKLEKFK